MRNAYPPECQAVIDQFSPLAARLAGASGLTLDDLRQEIAAAWVAGLDPAAAVPAALGVRRLGKMWKSEDLHLAARSAALPDGFEPAVAMPRPSPRLGSVAAGVAADCGVGLRAAQKWLKRQRHAAEQGQGDLFVDGGEA